MNTVLPRTSSSPSGETLTSACDMRGPIEPGFTLPAMFEVTAPQDSVCPQTSNISRPSAMYQRISSGEMGAAPVISTLARCTPISFLTLFSTSRRASQKAASSQTGTGLPSSRSLGPAQADADRQLVGPAAAARPACFKPIRTPE